MDSRSRYSFDPKSFSYEQFSLSLKRVKKKVTAWVGEIFRTRDAQLVEVEKSLELLIQKYDKGIFDKEGLKELKQLESM
jgi:hypothetical protein